MAAFSDRTILARVHSDARRFTSSAKTARVKVKTHLATDFWVNGFPGLSAMVESARFTSVCSAVVVVVVVVVCVRERACV